MSSVQHLTVVSPPFFTLCAEPEEVSAEARGWLDAALVVRAIRGRKAGTLEALFDEFSAAFQFPYYFGENWSAFRDCITDLDWLPFQPGVVVVIYGAEHVLQDAHPAELGTLVASLASAAEQFGQPVVDGEWWDRPAVPFHVVLVPDPGNGAELTARWSEAGASLTPLDL